MALDPDQPGSTENNRCRHAFPVANAGVVILFGFLTALFARDLSRNTHPDAIGGDSALMGISAIIMFIALYFLIKKNCGPSIANCFATLFHHEESEQPGLAASINDYSYRQV